LIEKTQKTDQTFAWGEQAKHKNLMRENDTKETFHEIQPIGRIPNDIIGNFPPGFQSSRIPPFFLYSKGDLRWDPPTALSLQMHWFFETLAECIITTNLYTVLIMSFILYCEKKWFKFSCWLLIEDSTKTALVICPY
jgi:hypothetical protein